MNIQNRMEIDNQNDMMEYELIGVRMQIKKVREEVEGDIREYEGIRREMKG